MAHNKLKIGDRNGMFEIVEFTSEIINEKKLHYCICKCECGNIKRIHRTAFKNTKSCGCLRGQRRGRRIKPLSIGSVFGKLTITEILDIKGEVLSYNCFCSCGNPHTVIHNSLVKGLVKSCGCLKLKKTIGAIFGDWKIIGIESKMKYSVKCISCGFERTLTSTYLSRHPKHNCRNIKKPIGDINHFLFIPEAADLWNVSSLAIKDRIKQAKLKGAMDTYIQKGWIRQSATSGNWLLSKDIMVEWYGGQPKKDGENNA